MKTLTLMRHAKSSWAHPELADFDRPLNPRGLRDAPFMAAWIAAQPDPPDRLLGSPARRARETLIPVAEALGRAPAEIVWDRSLYAADARTLLEALRRQPDSAQHLLLVGHNPGLTQLAAALTGEALEELPTAAVYSIRLPIRRWAELDLGRGMRHAFATPKRLRKSGNKG